MSLKVGDYVIVYSRDVMVELRVVDELGAKSFTAVRDPSEPKYATYGRDPVKFWCTGGHATVKGGYLTDATTHPVDPAEWPGILKNHLFSRAQEKLREADTEKLRRVLDVLGR